MKFSLRALCVVFVLPSLALHAEKPPDKKTAKSLSLLGKPAPDFTLSDFGNQTFHLADERGRIVVLAFWGTWCPPCRAEMPAFAELQKEWTGSGIDLIPVAFDEPAKARKFLESKRLDLRSLVDDGGKVAALYGAHYLPRAFVIGRDGGVAKVLIGKQMESDLRKALHDAR